MKDPLRLSIAGFWTYRFLRNAFFQSAISVIYFQSLGFSFREIFLLEGVYYLAKSLSEIPTGLFADRIGRRLSLFLGAMISALSYFLIYVSVSYWVFLAAKIALGISMSFSSGSDSAIVFDQLARRDRTQAYRRIEGIAWGARNLAFAVAAAVGSWVAVRYGHALPFLITAACNAAAGLALLAMRDGPSAAREGVRRPMRSFVAVLGVTDSTFLFMSLYAAVVFTYVKLIYWTMQPGFQELGLPIGWFGIFYSANLGISLVASAMVHRMDAFKAWQACGAGYLAMLLMSTLIAGGVFLGGAAGLIVASAGFCVHAVLQGIYDPVVKDYANGFADKSYRTTVLSAVSMLCNVGFAAASPVFGHGLEVLGISPTIMMALAVVTALCAALSSWAGTKEAFRKLDMVSKR